MLMCVILQFFNSLHNIHLCVCYNLLQKMYLWSMRLLDDNWRFFTWAREVCQWASWKEEAVGGSSSTVGWL